MGFSLRNFIRLTPMVDLNEHLEAVSGCLVDDIGCQAPLEKYIEAMEVWMQRIPDDFRRRLWMDFENAEQLAQDEFGRTSMRSVVLDNDALRLQFDAFSDTRACALWLSRTAPELFDRALAAHYADRNCNGKSWRAFAIDHDGDLNVKEEAWPLFRDGLAPALKTQAAPGRFKAEWFRRTLPQHGGNTERDVFQITIYTEGAPKAEMAFQHEDQLEQQIRMPVHEAALVYDPELKELDIVGRGGKPVHERLRDLFISTLIGTDVPVCAITRPDICFEPLQSSMPRFDIEPHDRVDAVSVERIRLKSNDAGGFTVTLEAKQPRGTCDQDLLHARSADAFSDLNPIGRPGWRIDHARLRVRFKPDGKQKEKAVAFDLYAPNRSNLRAQKEEHRIVINDLLNRWGFYRSSNDQ